MSDLRKLCRCGHVRGSHEDGPCRKCSCLDWEPAYLVFDVELPVGVVAVREAHEGLTLVACGHAPELVSPHGPWCGFCFGTPTTTNGYLLPVKRLVFAPTELRLL